MLIHLSAANATTGYLPTTALRGASARVKHSLVQDACWKTISRAHVHMCWKKLSAALAARPHDELKGQPALALSPSLSPSPLALPVSLSLSASLVPDGIEQVAEGAEDHQPDVLRREALHVRVCSEHLGQPRTAAVRPNLQRLSACTGARFRRSHANRDTCLCACASHDGSLAASRQMER